MSALRSFQALTDRRRRRTQKLMVLVGYHRVMRDDANSEKEAM
jgi:hypothetical protein